MSSARDFNSVVQALSNSCTSSGSTSFLDQASSHFGFVGGAGTGSDWNDCFLDFVFDLGAPPSLLLNTLEKNGIFGAGYAPIRLVDQAGVVGIGAADLELPDAGEETRRAVFAVNAT